MYSSVAELSLIKMSWQLYLHIVPSNTTIFLHVVLVFFFNLAGKQIDLIDFCFNSVSAGAALFLLQPSMTKKLSLAFAERCLPLTSRA